MKTIYDPRYRAVIGRLVGARKEAGLSQATVAERLEVPRVRITKIEKCDRRLDILELMALAEVYDIDLKEIIALLEEAPGSG